MAPDPCPLALNIHDHPRSLHVQKMFYFNLIYVIGMPIISQLWIDLKKTTKKKR